MAFWLETVCEQILPVQIDPRHDAVPRAAMACAKLGALRIRDVVGGDHVYVRSEADIRRGDPDTYQIGTPLGGSSILVQDGRAQCRRHGALRQRLTAVPAINNYVDDAALGPVLHGRFG